MLSLYREDRLQPTLRTWRLLLVVGRVASRHKAEATDFLVQGALQRIELRILPRLTKQLSVGAAFNNLAALHE